jgi:hypothetical protein
LEPIGRMTKTLNCTMYAETDHLKIIIFVIQPVCTAKLIKDRHQSGPITFKKNNDYSQKIFTSWKKVYTGSFCNKWISLNPITVFKLISQGKKCLSLEVLKVTWIIYISLDIIQYYEIQKNNHFHSSDSTTIKVGFIF